MYQCGLCLTRRFLPSPSGAVTQIYAVGWWCRPVAVRRRNPDTEKLRAVVTGRAAFASLHGRTDAPLYGIVFEVKRSVGLRRLGLVKVALALSEPIADTLQCAHESASCSCCSGKSGRGAGSRTVHLSHILETMHDSS